MYRPLFEQRIRDARIKLREQVEARRLRARSDRRARSRIPLGKRRMQKIRSILEIFDASGWPRDRMQRGFHDGFMKACAQRLYADDVNVSMQQIMDENGWENLKQQCVVMTPRRSGKTISVSMFSAAFGVAVPGSTQVLYSTGKRASAALLDNIQTFVNLADDTVHIQKCNQEELFFSVNGGVRTKIFSYPSNPRVR